MIKEIVHDPVFLAQKSEPATQDDAQIAQDLLDTLEAHRSECVGLAANMIGEKKNIIVVDNNGRDLLMYNPVIIKATAEYTATEGCLSLSGARQCRRYQSIIVRYRDADFKPQVKPFRGWTAEIIQHEIDHCSGILI